MYVGGNPVLQMSLLFSLNQGINGCNHSNGNGNIFCTDVNVCAHCRGEPCIYKHNQ
jgi:hypothetical protein